MTDTNFVDDLKEAKTNIYVANEYRFWPLAEAIIIGILFCGAIFVTTFFIFHHALEAQKGEIRDGLVRTGKVLEKFIDGDLHRTFVDQSQKTSKAYQDAVKPLQKAMDSDPTIPFAYTTVLKDGKVYFVLDAIPPDDPDAVQIMEEYEDASTELITTLKEHKVMTSKEPYTDEWGSFVSGHIPIFDSKGEFVGALSIDIDATAYFERLEPIKRATIRAMVTGFFISYLIAALVWFMRNFSATINRKRIQLLGKIKVGKENIGKSLGSKS